ncbi:MAG: hypothetical protein KGQ59_02745 [Bdellovibrionales bacterium]|nr:hypothetical protein [Bdellovibrionales bacterium]
MKAKSPAPTSSGSKTDKIDPLYVIFEQHLYNFQDSDSDRKTFISGVVSEYLTFLRQKNIAIPKSLELAISDELSEQVNTMLTKKIYGCLSIEDFQRGVPKTRKKRVRQKYQRMVG